MQEIIRIASLIFFAVPTCAYIISRDALFGIVYLFLFIYSVFAQIGYCFYPELSSQILAYFGPSAFFPANQITILSLASYLTLFMLFRAYVCKPNRYDVISKTVKSRLIGYVALALHFAFVAGVAIYYRNSLNYSSVGAGDFRADTGLLAIAFSINFKLMVVTLVVLYFNLRDPALRRNIPPNQAKCLQGLLFAEAVLFAIVCAQVGSRTDPAALIVGISIGEIQLAKTTKKSSIVKSCLKILIVIMPILYGLLVLEEIRNPDGSRAADISNAAWLAKDYYAPFHVLFAAVEYGFVEPLVVVVSNLANSLVLLETPLLQNQITELFNPGSSSRNAGYAFYIFTEGYMFAGDWGFIYNGIVVFSGVALWRLIASSNSSAYNRILLALISSQAINAVRSQSCYFIKNIYMFFIPALVLLYLVSGLRPSLKRTIPMRFMRRKTMNG